MGSCEFLCSMGWDGMGRHLPDLSLASPPNPRDISPWLLFTPIWIVLALIQGLTCLLWVIWEFREEKDSIMYGMWTFVHDFYTYMVNGVSGGIERVR